MSDLMTLQDAFFNVVHDYPGGSVSLAPRIGKNATSLSHEATRTGTAKAGLLDALKITQLTGDLRIVSSFAAACGQMLLPLPADQELDHDCACRMAAMAKEFGDVCREIADTLSDGKVTDNELLRVERECAELATAVNSMLAALVARNQACKPAGIAGRMK